MNTPEQAIREGVLNPISRVFLLLAVSYIIGIFHPLPEDIFYWITGPRVYENMTWEHVPKFVDPKILPVICAFFSDTVWASGPISIFCILCSSFDRWSWLKTTILGGYSTFLIYLLESWEPKINWLSQTGIYSLLILLLFAIVRPMRSGMLPRQA